MSSLILLYHVVITPLAVPLEAIGTKNQWRGTPSSDPEGLSAFHDPSLESEFSWFVVKKICVALLVHAHSEIARTKGSNCDASILNTICAPPDPHTSEINPFRKGTLVEDAVSKSLV